MAVFNKNNKSKKLKVFYFYLFCYAALIGIQLLFRYYLKEKELYFIAIRVQLAVEFCLLLFYFHHNFQNIYAKKLFNILVPLFLVFSIYDYVITSKTIFGADQAIVESLFILIILIYFFFEKIKYDVQAPLYEFKIFWIALAFFIFFSGNFFLLIYAKTMINDLNFRLQYVFVYSTFNITKNIILCIAILIKENSISNLISKKNSIDSFIDDSFFIKKTN